MADTDIGSDQILADADIYSFFDSTAGEKNSETSGPGQKLPRSQSPPPKTSGAARKPRSGIPNSTGVLSPLKGDNT